MNNLEKLKQLMMDVFLLSEEEFSLDLNRENLANWDSLGVVSIAVGVQETFGYHFTAEEAMAVQSVKDIISVLQQNGIQFDE